eukprot:6660271-Prymnesium_polylepis.1
MPQGALAPDCHRESLLANIACIASARSQAASCAPNRKDHTCYLCLALSIESRRWEQLLICHRHSPVVRRIQHGSGPQGSKQHAVNNALGSMPIDIRCGSLSRSARA